jgi:predicted Fe-Mo cluster-binding NifX family protein
MKRIALSTYRNRISSRLDSSDEILVLFFENGIEKKREKIRIVPSSPLDKIQQIKELNPDVLICGGLTQLCDNKLKNSKINVIPWVTGNIEDVLRNFLDGKISEEELVAEKMI